MQAQIDIAVRADARAGRAPIWDAATATLLWVDGPAHLVHRFFPAHSTDHTMRVPQRVGAAEPRERGGLLLHLAGGIALFDSDEHRRTWLAYWARDGFRAAGTAVDGTGAVWAATEAADESGGGWLVRVAPDGRTSTVLRDLGAPGGIGWNPERTRMYLADSVTRRVDVLDLDAAGLPASRRPLCDAGGEPAGLCVDAAGDLWVAIRDRGELHRYAPDGQRRATIPLPATSPTGCCFGGPDLTDLYVTTAGDGAAEPAEADGALLVLRNQTQGTRTTTFAG